MIHLVKDCVAGTRGLSELGDMQFCGLLDNLGLVVCASGSGRGGGSNSTDPPEDVL